MKPSEPRRARSANPPGKDASGFAPAGFWITSMKHLDLFTGSGIGILAAHECGIETVALCENNPCCLYCLKELWPDVYQFKDVHDVSAESLRKRGLWPIDLISGGVPCQPVSLAGKGKAEKDSRWLWPEVIRIVEEIRATWLVFENPLGLRSRGIDWILSSLGSMGYACKSFNLPAYVASLRHHRKRIWIVANANGNGLQRIQDFQEEAKGRRNITPKSLALCAWARGFGTLADVPRFTDGLSGGLLPKARNSLLRMVGNAWCYPIPRLIFEWIAMQGGGDESPNGT